MKIYKEVGDYTTGCSMTQWNEDCEQIIAEVERILNEYNLYATATTITLPIRIN